MFHYLPPTSSRGQCFPLRQSLRSIILAILHIAGSVVRATVAFTTTCGARHTTTRGRDTTWVPYGTIWGEKRGKVPQAADRMYRPAREKLGRVIGMGRDKGQGGSVLRSPPHRHLGPFPRLTVASPLPRAEYLCPISAVTSL